MKKEVKVIIAILIIAVLILVAILVARIFLKREVSEENVEIANQNVNQEEIVEVPKEPELPTPPVKTEPEPEPEPTFDINYWISYAQGVAVSNGLTLESSAVDCWDNPITANPDCIYLERDINSRMSRYAKDEDITDVWIWYECVGTNSYLIYVGYA